MTWLKIDDGFAEHPKIADLSDRSFRLHVAALCYCARNLTDGILDERGVRVVSAIVSRSRPLRQIRELVDAGLWVTVEGEDGCFAIKDFLEYNPSAEKVRADRVAARDRMKRLRSPERSSEHACEQLPHVRGPRPVPVKEPRAVALDVADGPRFEQLERMAVLAMKEMR